MRKRIPIKFMDYPFSLAFLRPNFAAPSKVDRHKMNMQVYVNIFRKFQNFDKRKKIVDERKKIGDEGNRIKN